MAKKHFDWDTYFDTASYMDVWRHSPMLQAGHAPTMYSPDRSELYISTIDAAVQTDCKRELDRMLDAVVGRFHDHKRDGYDRGCFAARIEIVELCSLLSGLSENPEKYLDPDLVMESKSVA